MRIKNNKKGFTLIELLMVIAIIGILITIGATSLNNARTKAQVAEAKYNNDQISKAISFLADDSDEWPGHQVAYTACVNLLGSCPANNELCNDDADSPANTCVNSLDDAISGLLTNHASPYKNWSGPYLKTRFLVDPWGNNHFFDTDYWIDLNGDPSGCSGIAAKSVAVVGSYGPDGISDLDPVDTSSYSCDDVIKVLSH